MTMIWADFSRLKQINIMSSKQKSKAEQEFYDHYTNKAINLPISNVVLLSSLDVGDKFAMEDEEDIIGDDYYQVLGKHKSSTSIVCRKPSGRHDRYFPETKVKRI